MWLDKESSEVKACTNDYLKNVFEKPKIYSSNNRITMLYISVQNPVQPVNHMDPSLFWADLQPQPFSLYKTFTEKANLG